MNVLSIILLIIAGICIWQGYARGLFQSVLVSGVTILAIVLSMYATPYVSKALQEYTSINEKIETAIVKQLDLDITKEESTRIEEMQLIDELPCPEILKMAIVNNNNSEVYEGFNVKGFQEYLAHYLSCIMMNGIAFVVMQIVISIALFVLVHVTKALTEIPIIHGIDKTGGICLGLIQALAIIWSLFVVISLFGNTELGMKAFMQINENPVLSFLYDHNWLMNTITNVSNVLKM